jgi:hypothetical protein
MKSLREDGQFYHVHIESESGGIKFCLRLFPCFGRAWRYADLIEQLNIARKLGYTAIVQPGPASRFSERGRTAGPESCGQFVPSDWNKAWGLRVLQKELGVKY